MISSVKHLLPGSLFNRPTPAQLLKGIKKDRSKPRDQGSGNDRGPPESARSPADSSDTAPGRAGDQSLDSPREEQGAPPAQPAAQPEAARAPEATISAVRVPDLDDAVPRSVIPSPPDPPRLGPRGEHSPGPAAADDQAAPARGGEPAALPAAHVGGDADLNLAAAAAAAAWSPRAHASPSPVPGGAAGRGTGATTGSSDADSEPLLAGIQAEQLALPSNPDISVGAGRCA